jgi:methylenetetrahydrofolate reductase (NADPH)
MARPVSRLAALVAHPQYEVLPLDGVLDELGALRNGATVTVTCSPRRGLGPTVDLAMELVRRGLRAVPHIAARSLASERELRMVSESLHDVGVTEVFVIGGDRPEPLGPFAAASDVLEFLADLGRPFAEVGVAAYPEGHPLIDDDALQAALQAKAVHATYCVTQLCFDADPIVKWIRRQQECNPHLPVRIGVPGAVDRGHLLRISLRVGVGESRRFVSHHRGLVPRLLQPGGYRPDPLVRQLAARLPQGAPVRSLHVYTFNQVAKSTRWMRRAQERAA